MQGLGPIREDERGENIKRGLLRHSCECGQKDFLWMFFDDGQHRRAVDTALGEQLAEHRCLEDAEPDIKSNADKDQT